jgi:hypothetical protein
VRFAFKTSPQDTSWDAMLEVGRAADDIDVFESGCQRTGWRIVVAPLR